MKKLPVYILIAFVILFYVLNVIIPFYGDDYAMMFNADGTLSSSLSDLFVKTCDSYTGANGRLACNFLMYAFPTLVGETVYNLLNTFAFAFTLYCFLKVAHVSLKQESLFTLCLVILGFFVMMMEGGSLFFWGAGAANYLWSMMMTMAYLALLFHVSESKRNYSVSMLFGFTLLSFGLGVQHEIFVLPVSFSLFVYYVINRQKINKPILSLLCGFFLSALFVLLSPGNFNRLGNESNVEVLNLMSVIRRFAGIAMDLKITYLLVITLIVTLFKYKKLLIDYLQSNYFWWIAFLSSLLIPVAAGQSGRALIGAELFALILLLKLIDSYPSQLTRRRSLSLLTLIWIYMGFVTYDSYKKWSIINMCQQDYLTKNQYVIIRDEYKGFSFTSPFTINVDECLNSGWTRKRLAKYKEVLNHSESEKLMVTIPKSTFDVMENWDEKLLQLNKISGNAGFYSNQSLSYYIMPSDSVKKMQIEQGYLYKIQRLPFFSSRGMEINYDRTTIDVDPCPVLFVENCHGDWILLNKEFKKYFGIECDTISIHAVLPINRFKFIPY